MERMIITSPTFKRKFNNICDHLAKDFGNKAVLDFIKRLDLKINSILSFPEIGRPIISRKNTRSLIVKPHNKLFFKIYPNKIALLDIIDMRMDPSKNPFR